MIIYWSSQNDSSIFLVDESSMSSVSLSASGSGAISQKCERRTLSLIQEPGSTYIGQVSPSSSSSNDITQSIISRLSELSISLEKLEVVGSDGTVTNTGWKNGVIHRLENHIGRPLQWRICLLHFNELPFRHIFQLIDGQTAGSKSFSGPTGQQFTCCEKLPVVCYEPIECSIPDIDRNLERKDETVFVGHFKCNHLGTLSRRLGKSGHYSFVPFQMANCGQLSP
ncbi:hypothetical protein AVEN_86885-1 [Araneus ventricosus]|uniref:Uncharacterized protein n=1 Tax=Araneus ventricosus TaxID=182803 RepID=A0A4Y2W1R1_ARAVE|nr:hypothetical protein AVEN_11574-1 [Araneus ventricosus]GBO31166.1 hypothetical protein AVEN_86885-1 [Araneus ventricosus]